jgi:hypothetical protein
MDEICGLKFRLSCRRCLKFFLFEIPPCAHHVIFITEFVLLIKTPSFYEVNSFDRKWLAHGGISKIFFQTTFYKDF